mmetsp:Transcript_3275/g.4514  ORF Transcript_3275/g.4514 Transcript_3275/m.4514 type:complete len:420 (+) Transcript_3275:60-1319(+)
MHFPLFCCLLISHELCSLSFQFSFNRLSTVSTRNIASFRSNAVSDRVTTSNQPIVADDAPMRVWASIQKLALLISEIVQISEPNASNIVKMCDVADTLQKDSIDLYIVKIARSNMLISMLQRNRTEYIEVASFLANRIPRNELPNLQNVPIAGISETFQLRDNQVDGIPIVEDCSLPVATFEESLLDKLLLPLFRSLVQKEINWKSPTKGIRGLLEEGRYYKLSEEGQVNDSFNQHRFVKTVVRTLLTPFLPPFFRIFMSGIVPSTARGDPAWLVSLTESTVSNLPLLTEEEKASWLAGKQFGPIFYAPFLTSLFTPPFLSFLVGPSHMNRRKDGKFGGIVVEKCKFLQESNCKGLCLHQCKIPVQEFFQDELGLPLTVTPNFVTQECQWSWGEAPLPHSLDENFPRGCISGCETRASL